MVELVPITVKNCKWNEDGSPRFDSRGQPSPWPNIDVIPLKLWGGAETPGHLIRRYGGWNMDTVEHLGTGAPFGLALCFVPWDFAQAMLELVDSAQALTLAEAEVFCDTRAFIGRPAVERDANALQALLAERELRRSLGIQGAGVDDEILCALDLDDPTPGVRRSPRPFSFADLRRRLEAGGNTLQDGR